MPWPHSVHRSWPTTLNCRGQPVGREVANLVARAIGDRPLVGVIDDVQFATPDLRHFLEQLVPSLLNERADLLFLVGQQFPPFNWSEIPTHHVTIGGLDRAAAHELTDRRGGLSDRFEQVFQASLGSPLLLLLSVATPWVEATSTTLPGGRRWSAHRLGGPGVASHYARERAASAQLDIGGRWHPPHRSGQVRPIGTSSEVVGRSSRDAPGRSRSTAGRADASRERSAHLSLSAFYARSHRPDALRERFLHLVAAEEWRRLAAGSHAPTKGPAHSRIFRPAQERITTIGDGTAVRWGSDPGTSGRGFYPPPPRPRCRGRVGSTSGDR